MLKAHRLLPHSDLIWAMSDAQKQTGTLKVVVAKPRPPNGELKLVTDFKNLKIKDAHD